MAIITLEELKAQVNIDADDTSHDNELQPYLDAGTLTVARYRNEAVDQESAVEYKRVYRRRMMALSHVPVRSLTSIEDVETGVAWDVSKVELESTTGVVDPLLGMAFSGYLKVKYEAGYENPPANYKLAALVIAQHVWETQRGAAGAPIMGDLETTMQAGGTAAKGFAIPNRAVELLGGNVPGVA